MKLIPALRAWLNSYVIFYETFMSVKQNLFVHKCLIMLNGVEYTTFKMFCHANEQLSLCYFFSINVL